MSAEGAVTYKALLFIPGATPFDFYSKDYEKGLQLYSNGVLIMDKCADLLPEHFRFVRGVVDSPDLSLNISRELLQHDRQLKVMASNIEKKIKAELVKMMKDDRPGYETFWKNFGRQLKYGLVSDYGAHKDQLQDLMLFYSSTEKKLVSLDEYVSRMKEDQKVIYYAAGDNVNTIDKLPQIVCAILHPATAPRRKGIPQLVRIKADGTGDTVCVFSTDTVVDDEPRKIQRRIPVIIHDMPLELRRIVRKGILQLQFNLPGSAQLKACTGIHIK